jgi:hypothetical protein
MADTLGVDRSSRLVMGMPVEYPGPDNDPSDEEGWLRHGHPGRVTDPSWQDVFVDWDGLEDQGASRWVCYDLPGLNEITDQEYARRVACLDAGLPPID